ATLRAAPALAAPRADTRSINCLRTTALRVAPALAARRGSVRNQTAFHSKNGVSRQMLLRAAPEAEDEE
ncbi:hypothetical protein A2U01_0114416, partial [Trifolium medium]|nr:hypothetical protein [Trifolium medium]